ncbi:hypothetical protein ACFOET_03110 [Parapedobacter deserti]|uniref:Beta-lactamase-inhibitor-like PepSY-like domain-containing protein n=1 Tax=Parapedobacter deserti TaxID=1912957 RepID=A0ABV7JES6_9SPHI
MMKTTTIKNALMLTAGLAISSILTAQTKHLSFDSNTSRDENTETHAIHDRRTVSLPPLVKKHIEKHYHGYSSANWFIYESGIIGKFEIDGLRHTSLYGIDGSWKHTVIYYPYERISDKIKNIVKRRYPSYELRRGFEIHAKSARPRTVVHIENDTELKEVAIRGKYLIVLKSLQISTPPIAHRKN